MTQSTPPIGEPLVASELQRRAISGAAWTVVHALVSVPIAFAANAVVAHSLGVSSYGRLAFLTSTFGLVLVFANFGFSSALIQKGSRAEASGRRGEADDLLRRSLGFHLFAELPILLALTFALTRGQPWWETLVVGLAVTLTCLLSGAALSITIQNRTAAAARLSIVLNLALQGASVATALLTRSPSAVWAVRMLIPALALGLTFTLLDPDRRSEALRPRLPRGLGSIFWRYGLASWASGLLGALVFSRSEIFLLEAYHRTTALGLFALAFGLSQQITAPVDSMGHALWPAIAGVLSAWPDRASQAFERGMRISSLLSGCVAASLVPALVFAVPVVYGRAFSSAAWLFVPLALTSIFQSVNTPVLAFANARQRGGLILRANGVALVADVLVAVVLIPPFGVWGAVVANIVGQAISLLWLALTEPLARNGGLRGLSRRYQPFVYGVASGCIGLVLGAVLKSFSPALAFIVAFGAGSSVFVVSVRRSRIGFTPEDCEALLGAVGQRARPHTARVLRLLCASAF